MKVLKQKYHGLPGIGVNGLNGSTGENGKSIYTGFINNFFDGDDLPIETFIYVAKRMLNHGPNGTQSDLDTSTIDAAWAVTQDEIKSVYNDNTFLKDVVQNSSNNATSYLNYKIFYYTDNRLLNSSIANGIVNESTLSQAKDVELDLTGDFVSMSFMLKTADGNNDIDLTQYKFEEDTKAMFKMTNANYSNIGIENLYNVTNNITNYDFKKNSSIYIKIPDTTDIILPWDTNDAVYKESSTAGKALETGILLDNDQYSNYYTFVPENTSVSYIKEVIPTYMLDTNMYQGYLSNDGLNVKSTSGQDIEPLNWEDAGYFNAFYKTSFTNEDFYDGNIYTEGDLRDANGKSFYGLASTVLYDNKGSENVKVNSNIPYDINFDYINRYNQSKDHYKVLLETSMGLPIYYSLDDGDKTLFVPTTLSSKYKVGDILYFYIDETDFIISNRKLKYMVVITEDLLHCTPMELINAAELVDPLDIKLITKNTDNNHILSHNNIGVLLDKSTNTKKLTNKSYINISDNYTDAAVLLNAYKNYKINQFSTINSSLSGYINSSNNFEINSSTTVKSQNLYVNNNISRETNVELYTHIYNSNIKLYSNNFIKPLVDINLYNDPTNEDAAVFLQTVNADDYFYDTNKDIFYGCDIYNSKMEKIKTISSTTDTIDVNFVPTTNNTLQDYYYIQMFACGENGLKYFSKLTKITISYILSLYQSSIGNFSKSKKIKKLYNKGIGTYSNKRYQVKSIKIEIIGDDQYITKQKKSGNIFFDLSDITAEQCNDVSLNIYTEDPSIIIDDVFFNTINNTAQQFSNNWAAINNCNVETNNYEYIINLSTNLPIFNSAANRDTTIIDYLKNSDTHNSYESTLFTLLSNNNYVKPTTIQRSILVTSKYHYVDRPNEYYYENFNIVQPGFTDTRDIPIIELNTHTSMSELQSYNTIENGILSNQFVTYLDINIKDFKNQWGQFTNNASILLDIDISNIDYDLNWQNTYIIEDAVPRRTFRTILEGDSSIAQLNNYVKINTTLFETTEHILNTSIADSTNGTLQCGGNFDILQNFILYNTDSSQSPQIINDEYILYDDSFLNAIKKPNIIFTGLNDKINLSLTDIPVCDDIDTIKLKLMVEMGNPLLSNMYFRFAVNKINIKVIPLNSNEPINFFTTAVDGYDTYLAKSVRTNKQILERIYKYISKPIDVTINPISYIICPNDAESTYTNLYGGIYKYGVKDQIKKELKFYNTSIYENNIYDVPSDYIRSNKLYPFNNLYIKKSYIQDNIKTISATPVSLWDTRNNINYKQSLSLNTSVGNHNILDFIEGNKYLSIVYHSNIMRPRLKDDKYIFTYNDENYLRFKYDQKNNNMPIFVYDDQSIELRNNELIHSMDKWNDWYTEKYNGNDYTYTGVLSLYGNGYTQILDSDANDVVFYKKKVTVESSGRYDRNKNTKTTLVREHILNINEVKQLNNVSINSYSSIDEINVEPMKNDQPNHDEYFRGFLYDINWEFPYYDNKNSIIPFRIVTGFDNLLNNCQSNIPAIYQDYYNALTNLADASYGTNMVPYTLLFDINPRICYNYENDGINVLMLRRPTISNDTEYIDSSNYKSIYNFNHQLFDTDNISKIPSPYIIKSN